MSQQEVVTPHQKVMQHAATTTEAKCECLEPPQHRSNGENLAPAAEAPTHDRGSIVRNSGKDTPDGSITSEDAAPFPILRGAPITISKCKFQAHIARVTTVAGAEAVSKAISAQIGREAGLASFVCPYAYRIGPSNLRGGKGGEERNNSDKRSSTKAIYEIGERDGDAGDNQVEGGFDNGDVGSGDKLLYLLQKWDIQDAVLGVTRIDGGFAMAEIMGIRRHKFVVDRGKRLLEISHLASLRRAVDVDLNPPTQTPQTDAARPGRHCSQTGEKGGWGAKDRGRVFEDKWDRSPSRRRTACTVDDDKLLLGSGVDRLSRPREKANVDMRHCHGEKQQPQGVDGDSEGVPYNSTRRNGEDLRCFGQGRFDRRGCHVVKDSMSNRRALSLTQLSISSKTVAFPAGHVPSMMGAKGHGKKRGRINHFAVKTPLMVLHPDSNTTPNTDHNTTTTTNSNNNYYDAFESTTIAPSTPRGIGVTSGWNLPCDLDPTSEITSFAGGRQGDSGRARVLGAEHDGMDAGGGSLYGGSRVQGRWEASSSTLDPVFHCSSTNTRVTTGSDGLLASRASGCSTINFPGRVSALVSRLANDHDPLHPPPPSQYCQHHHEHNHRNLQNSACAGRVGSPTLDRVTAGSSACTPSASSVDKSAVPGGTVNNSRGGDADRRKCLQRQASTTERRGKPADNNHNNVSGEDNVRSTNGGGPATDDIARGDANGNNTRMVTGASPHRPPGRAIHAGSTGVGAREGGSGSGSRGGRAVPCQRSFSTTSPTYREWSLSRNATTGNGDNRKLSRNRTSACPAQIGDIRCGLHATRGHGTSSVDHVIVGHSPATGTIRDGVGGGKGGWGGGEGGAVELGPTSVGGWNDESSISTMSGSAMDVQSSTGSAEPEGDEGRSLQERGIKTACENGARHQECTYSHKFGNPTSNYVDDEVTPMAPRREKGETDESDGDNDVRNDCGRMTRSGDAVREWTPTLPVERGP